jgi:nucleoside-diphosphate-sugar epimerase
VRTLIGSNCEIVFKTLPQDDPKQRRPDISKAQKLLGWEPKIMLREGLALSRTYFQTCVDRELTDRLVS